MLSIFIAELILRGVNMIDQLREYIVSKCIISIEMITRNMRISATSFMQRGRLLRRE